VTECLGHFSLEGALRGALADAMRSASSVWELNKNVGR